MVEFFPRPFGFCDPARHGLSLYVVRSQVEGQPQVSVRARLPAAMASVAEHALVVAGVRPGHSSMLENSGSRLSAGARREPPITRSSRTTRSAPAATDVGVNRA
jgi:hypothetical protein